jgi:hypothetical protein
MRMVSRTQATQSVNRPLVVLAVAVLAALAVVAAVRALPAAPLLEPAAPLYVPAESPVRLAPAFEGTSPPLPTSNIVGPGAQTGASPVPAEQTTAPASIGVRPERLPSLDGNDPTSPRYAPQGPDGKFPGFQAPARN